MELLKSLEWRYATKKMNGNKIPQEKLNTILESIRLAPSSYGLTPYNIIVVESDEVKSKLLPVCYGQTQITDSSVVLVFANWLDITDEQVDNFMNEIVDTRNVKIEDLQGYSDTIKNQVKMMSTEDKNNWASKQTYIGLGFGMVAAAIEGVDSTPMEGFSKDGVDEVLGLKEKGLASSVILVLGYRDENNDYLVNQKKVRRESNKLFINL